MTKPITPDEARELRPRIIPAEMFEAYNEAIIENLDSRGTSRFKLKLVEAKARSKGIDIRDAYDKRWFDVEPYYREAGWEVTFDRPGYNESYDSNFTFRIRRG